jgi:uncharacterized protein
MQFATDFANGCPMNKRDVIGVLQRNEDALRARGISHAAVFGSVARGDARPDSDIDIMIELDPQAKIGVFEYAGIKLYIEGLFEGPVDVVDREALKPTIRMPATSDAIYAF